MTSPIMSRGAACSLGLCALLATTIAQIEPSEHLTRASFSSALVGDECHEQGSCDVKLVQLRAQAHRTDAEEWPAVAATIAVHPPKFFHVARFLEEWTSCPPAQKALSVYVIFSTAEDQQLFHDTLQKLHPALVTLLNQKSKQTWHEIISQVPPHISDDDSNKQFFAAWKKWFGIAHLLDLQVEKPKYGLMLDAELRLFNASTDCDASSHWPRLLSRIQEFEAAKLWPAAQVSKNLVTFKFASGTMNGFMYDQALIDESLRFVKGDDWRKCRDSGCLQLHKQHDECLFSWWTDLPWLNLEVAARLLQQKAKDQGVTMPQKDSAAFYQTLLRGMNMPRFEYMAYQQWCCLHEDFSFRDVTPIVGYAKWGSYLEDPQPGARLAELSPMWISGDAMVSWYQQKIGDMNRTDPPLLVFHVDHKRDRFETKSDKKLHHLWDEAWNTEAQIRKARNLDAESLTQQRVGQDKHP